MTRLDSWLKQATRHLSKDAAAQVRTEIEEHYWSAHEAAIADGAAGAEADLRVIAALGDARLANREYRRVMLTCSEARALREGDWEARTLCSRKWLLLAVPLAVLCAGVAFLLAGKTAVAQVPLAGGAAMAFLLGATFLPIYTPARARIYRWVKWATLLALFAAAFDLKSSWLLISCLWPLAWTEWTRIALRRKLPVADWPKQLYL